MATRVRFERGIPRVENKKAALRKRNHARDARRFADVAAVPANLCRGFPQTVVRVMEESLLGDPMTIFVPDGSNENTGARGYRYFRAASSNADWWQALPESIDRNELRYAMSRVTKCEPLVPERIEHRWLIAFVKDARKNGWCAAFDGRASPLCVSPEPPMKRAKLRGTNWRRVWLALPEFDYVRLLLDSRALHESPNLFVQGILKERWQEHDHERDERAAIQDEGERVIRPRLAARAGRGPATPADEIPF